MNPMDLKRGAQAAVENVVAVLESISRPITTKEEIAQVGTISANGERAIGDLLSEAMESVELMTLDILSINNDILEIIT